MEIHPRVHHIVAWFGEVRVNLYLITGERNAIIDTGIPESPQNDIAPALEKLGMTLADIHLIINTHGHWDHIGGNAAIKSASHARILIHADDAIFLEDREAGFTQHMQPALEAIAGKERFEEQRARFMEIAGPNLTVDRKLKDNDIIELGDGCDLRVIHLPGHSVGSVGYYWEKEGILFTGDTLQGMGEAGGRIPIIEDFAAYKKSLERLDGLPVEFILSAHDYRGVTIPPSNIKRGKEVSEYLRDCREAAERIDEAVRRVAPYTSGKPYTEIYDQVVNELPAELGFKPASQIPDPSIGLATVFRCLSQVNQ